MKTHFAISFILLGCLVAANAHAEFTGKGHVHRLAETKQVFSNTDCRATDSCDLKRFTLTEMANEIWFSDDPRHATYGNGVVMEYETDSVAALEKYAIVQFKKGCVFHLSRNDSGKLTRDINDVVPSFGEYIPFCFPRWVIDSQDRDPVYNSDPEYGRFYLMRWNRPGSYDNRTQKYYGAEKPQKPVVYMIDNPAGAFVTGRGVRNVALEFRTCIYKAREVPARTHRENIGFATPIACFQWRNVYLYDFAKASFHSDLAAAPKWQDPAAIATEHDDSLLAGAALFMALGLIVFLRLCRRQDRLLLGA